jgi:hypothetical protein
MAIDPEALYAQLGHLMAGQPASIDDWPVPPEVNQWFARILALLDASGSTLDATEMRVALMSVTSPLDTIRTPAIHSVIQLLHRAFARAELNAPTKPVGAFIPAGNSFDALVAVGKVLEGARGNVLIVDPYMDEKALTDFAPLAPASVTIKLLTDQKSYKPSLAPAAKRWASQHGRARPLEVRLAAGGTLHDRLAIIDDKDVWLLTQSLNAFATRAPASIVRVDVDTAALKVAAYRDMWVASTPLS